MNSFLETKQYFSDIKLEMSDNKAMSSTVRLCIPHSPCDLLQHQLTRTVNTSWNLMCVK